MLDIDIPAIRAEAKSRWKREQATRSGLFDIIGQSVPWWVIIIGMGLAALSAAHTAGVFSQLSPVGYAGPFVVEFVLLWAAFSRVVAKAERSSLSSALRVLEALAFVMALIANGIGALDRVSAESGIDTLSFDAILQQFSALPIRTQAGVVVIPLFALFIPVGTWVAGEGIAELLMRGRHAADKLETLWAEVERGELYRAFYEAYLDAGARPVEARRQAAMISTGFIAEVSGVLSVTSDMPRQDSGPKASPKLDKAKQLLSQNPGWHDTSTRELEAQTGISRNVWSEAKREINQNGNGHHQ
jgi:hypothetical protein